MGAKQLARALLAKRAYRRVGVRVRRSTYATGAWHCTCPELAVAAEYRPTGIPSRSYLRARAVVMGADSDGRFSYASGGAELYDALGIEGTTYEIGFGAVRRALGDIQGGVSLISAAAPAVVRRF
jgi:hypothetical protein